MILRIVLTEAYSRSYKAAIKAEMIKASSSTTDGSTGSTRQRFTDSRTNTLVNESLAECSLNLPPSPVPSQLRNVTFLSSSRNDDTFKLSEPLNHVGCEARKQTTSSGGEDMTAHSLYILRHTEMLQSLLKIIQDNEILEIVSFFIP